MGQWSSERPPALSGNGGTRARVESPGQRIYSRSCIGVISMDKPSGSVPEQVQQFAPKPKSRKDWPTDDLRGLLHRAAGIFSNEKYRRTGALPRKVADENSSSVPDLAPKHPAEDGPIDTAPYDPTDRAGHAVITILQKAASTSNEEYERATRLADDLANKLRTTERRIEEFEAEAARFRDRAVRAEEWMQRIAREIESMFNAPEGASSRNANPAMKGNADLKP